MGWVLHVVSSSRLGARWESGCCAGSSGLRWGETGLVQNKGHVVPCVTTYLRRKSCLGNMAEPIAGSGGCPQHCLAWQVTVRAQASFLPSWGSASPVSCPRRLAGHPRERGGRKEVLPLIVPSSAGSDNSSFLPHASGPAVGPMGWGCSQAPAWCRESREVWDWHGGVPDPWMVLPAGGHWGHGCELFHGEPAQFGPLLWLLWAGSSLLPNALDTVCLFSCPRLVPVIPGWSERTVKSCPPALPGLQLSPRNPIPTPTHHLIPWLIPQAINTALAQRAVRPCGHPTGQVLVPQACGQEPLSLLDTSDVTCGDSCYGVSGTLGRARARFS